MILIGHNGAGKSTFINYLLGFYKNETQHPFLAHYKEHKKPLNKNEVGYSPEVAFLDDRMSAKDYMDMIGTLKGVHKIDYEKTLKEVHLFVDIKSQIKTYSKGMKQRLLLALAFVGNPKTVILDEPTSGLDPFGRIDIEGLLLSLKHKHEFVISTHSLEFAFNMEDEIWIVQDGKFVYQDRPNSLQELKELFFKFKSKKGIE